MNIKEARDIIGKMKLDRFSTAEIEALGILLDSVDKWDVLKIKLNSVYHSQGDSPKDMYSIGFARAVDIVDEVLRGKKEW